MIKKILLTGFGPFAENNKNLTEEIVISLNNLEIDNFKVYSFVLPVTYSGAKYEIENKINTIKPDLVLSLGLAASRKNITPELIGINYKHSETPDNNNYRALFEKIDASSSSSFYSTLPLEKIITDLKSKGFPIKLSTDAGSYVCNTVLYSALKYIEDNQLNIPCGFIHLPSSIEYKVCFNAIKEVLKILIKEFK